MKKLNRGRKLVIYIVLGIFFLSTFLCIFSNVKIDRAVLEKNLKQINNECNLVYNNMETSENKYKDLLEVEDDPFNRGLYSSALVQFYTINNDYDNAIKYSKDAVANYNKVKGGEYYSIAEKKYAAWFMLKLGRYSESFKETSELLDLLNSSSKQVFTTEEVLDTEALIYSIFLCIYSQFEIMDKAEIYYNKLCDIEMTPSLQIAKGDKISASKMLYAEKIEDPKLMKRYADECYENSLKRDAENGTNVATVMLTNVALANIKLGDLEVGFEQLQKSEKYHEETGRTYGLVDIYINYAEYYSAIGNNELAIKYYCKTIELYSDYKDYFSLKYTINELIKFSTKNNIIEDIDKYYKEYYDLSEKIGGDRAVNELLSQILEINDDLNKSRVLLLEQESRDNDRAIGIFIVVIVILTLMVTRMYSLIKSKIESEKKLEKIANTDYLTKVNTRAYGEKLIMKSLKEGNIFSMAIIDIDNFKNINDTYGHIFGDVILTEIARKLSEEIGSQHIIARFGGEEFIIAFINKDKYEAKKILDKIRIDVSKILFENNTSVTFSAGIEDWDDSSLSLIIEKADNLLYKAKSEGRNKVINL